MKLLPLPKFSVLIMLSIFAMTIVLSKREVYKKNLLSFKINPTTQKKIVKRFLVLIPAVFILSAILTPSQLFRYPVKEPINWVLTAPIYSLFSALPQEILYRVFFFQRYKPIFRKKSTLFLANALAFSFLHIIYNNPVAPILSFAGGYLFSSTYNDTGSLPITALEHSIYGYFIFTAGLGQIYFM